MVKRVLALRRSVLVWAVSEIVMDSKVTGKSMGEMQTNNRREAELEQLFKLLRELWNHRQANIKELWDRFLPSGDYLIDRWEKARAAGFGVGTSVYDSSLILGDVKVGEHTWIGPFTVLDGTGGLTIGDYCSISAGVQIYTHDSVQWALTSGKAEYDKSPTHIGNNCYLGPNVVVAKGVSIADGCVIGANSLVLCDIPAKSKAVGTPCRVVGISEK